MRVLCASTHTHTHTHTHRMHSFLSSTKLSGEITTQLLYTYVSYLVILLSVRYEVDCVWHVMAHEQKPDLVFRRNGRVHLNRLGRQFSRLLAAEVCTSAVVMLDTPCPEVVWRVLATQSFRQFPLHFTSRASRCAITFQPDFTAIYVWGYGFTWITLYLCSTSRSAAPKIQSLRIRHLLSHRPIVDWFLTIKEHQNVEPAVNMKLLIGPLQKRAPIMKTCALKFQHIHSCLSLRFRPFIWKAKTLHGVKLKYIKNCSIRMEHMYAPMVQNKAEKLQHEKSFVLQDSCS